MSAPDNNTTVLVELGQVKGQLSALTDLIRQNHTATQTRIEDLSKSVGVRFDGIEKRLATLEQNERGTAMRAAGSACLVGGFDRASGKLCVVEAVVARMIPDRQISQIIEFQKVYRCLVWGVESIQFQEFFRQELIKRSAAAGVPVPAVALTPHSDKDLRIESLSPHVNNGLILFNQAHTVLNTQVRHWPEADHDDGPDALHMLWMLAQSRAGGIPKIRTGKTR